MEEGSFFTYGTALDGRKVLFGNAMDGRKVVQQKHYIWNCPGWKKVSQRNSFWNYLLWRKSSVFWGGSSPMEGRKEGRKEGRLLFFWGEVPWKEGSFFLVVKSHGRKEGCYFLGGEVQWKYALS